MPKIDDVLTLADGSSPSAAWKFITVSPVSGTLKNNGADFGPDTPGTTTSGIQEAINQAVTNNGGRIILRQGAYTLASNTNVGCSTNVPASTPPSTVIALQIEGETGATTGLPNYNGYPTHGVIITAAPGATTGVGIVDFSGAYINLRLSNIVVEQPTASPMWHGFSYGDPTKGASVYIENCSAIQNNTTAQPTTLGTTGIGFRAYDTAYPGTLVNCTVSGYATGYQVDAHWDLINCGVGFCGTALSITDSSGQNQDHPARLVGFKAERCNVFIANTGGGYFTLIGDMEIEWMTSGTFALSHFVSDSGNKLSGEIYLTGHIVGGSGSAGDSRLPIPYATLNNSGGANLRIRQVAALGFSITTPAVPAGTGSGNKVTNTFPFPVRVYAVGASGGHIIDPLGNDSALGVDPLELTLDPQAAYYVATTAPSAWKWYGG
jgi:hypothetical protein